MYVFVHRRDMRPQQFFMGPSRDPSLPTARLSGIYLQSGFVVCERCACLVQPSDFVPQQLVLVVQLVHALAQVFAFGLPTNHRPPTLSLVKMRFCSGVFAPLPRASILGHQKLITRASWRRCSFRRLNLVRKALLSRKVTWQDAVPQGHTRHMHAAIHGEWRETCSVHFFPEHKYAFFMCWNSPHPLCSLLLYTHTSTNEQPEPYCTNTNDASSDLHERSKTSRRLLQ